MLTFEEAKAICYPVGVIPATGGEIIDIRPMIESQTLIEKQLKASIRHALKGDLSRAIKAKRNRQIKNAKDRAFKVAR